MALCIVCSREIPSDSRVCPYCTAPQVGGLVTASVRADAEIDVNVAMLRLPASDSIDGSRFSAGSVLAERYRIVGLVGKGGMGEVYRADDLKLRQPVALKFLPEALSKDRKRLDRFHHEVRVAREVSHPNVCRVYDIGEVDGQPFLTMEYVVGEDLASVMRRMGRPTKEKALQIARQLCAGLAAAHDRGILHRDLKPHNVMLDERGRVRITDFGLAGFVEQFTGAEVRAGTPAYMAPEQLAGKEVSVKSDIYALGLVLYELFTGKRAREGTATELLNRSHGSMLTSPSSLVDDVDPATERVILRCLENEPSARPSSALAVAAALPGGDPLAAALAAGETPSPEMVALGGEEGLLRPRTAVMLLATLFACMVGWFFLSDRIFLTAMVPLPKTPEQLAGTAGDILVRLGYDQPPTDREFGFKADDAYLEYLKKKDHTSARWTPVRAKRPSALMFWYRQSPSALHALQDDPMTWKSVSLENPPAIKPGMIGLQLDPQGRLLELIAVPEPFTAGDEVKPASDKPDWKALFDEAGLEMTRFTESTPNWRPPVQCDERAAWDGTFDDSTDVPVRVEAGAIAGRAVAFRVLLPWQIAESGKKPSSNEPPPWMMIIFGLVFLVVFTGGGIMAWRNLRLGRGDRRGALRLAIVGWMLILVTLLPSRARIAGISDFTQVIFLGMTFSLFWAAWLWAFYMAAEPFIRRRWPDRLTSWTRLLSGRWRDPLVGRDLLIGVAAGMGLNLAYYVLHWVLRLPFGEPIPRLIAENLYALHGAHYTLGHLVNQVPVQVTFTLFILLLILMVRAVVGRLWLAIAITWLFIMLPIVSKFAEPLGELLPSLVVDGLYSGAMLFVVTRFGLLGAIMTSFAMFLALMPGAADLTAWYAQPMLTSCVVIAAIAIFGFYTSLAGRPLFRDELLDT